MGKLKLFSTLTSLITDHTTNISWSHFLEEQKSILTIVTILIWRPTALHTFLLLFFNYDKSILGPCVFVCGSVELTPAIYPHPTSFHQIWPHYKQIINEIIENSKTLIIWPYSKVHSRIFQLNPSRGRLRNDTTDNRLSKLTSIEI